ncbi:hypothetical protein PCNPT3_09515 [Psychromonas sp. CNPT3]|uniref:YcxB family protein n=1 Tax=Psychromonas sp. CNPT3 TaxID=314282 RepID=UPI00006E9145|nr:YcxB family protein [Psychromonas sp. CNPT3]AGH81841.1 hypothetical protein PCNPT3_09515 [Psychromonas sp. CNPT3]
MQFSTEFTLDRKHFSECFEQSAFHTPPKKPRAVFIIGLLLFGTYIIVLTQHPNLLGLFFFALAGLEYFSVKYQKAWWLCRQMWSKNSGNKIHVEIDDQGIKTSSLYINNNQKWTDIKSVINTPKGILLLLENGQKNYLSQAHFNKDVFSFISKQCQKNSEKQPAEK